MPRKRTHEEFVEIVKEKYGDEYSVLGIYKSCHEPILLRHNKCGHEWDTTQPNDFIKKKPNLCPKCSHPSRKKSNTDFVKEIIDLVGDEYIFLEEYKTNMTKIKCRHNKCGHEWDTTPNNFLSGSRCPLCNQLNTESKGIKKIKEILDNNSIKYEQEVKLKDEKFTKRMDQCLKFDIYIKSLNLAIEYDGEFHYDEKKYKDGLEGLLVQKRRDERKNNYCVEKGINLIRIPFWKKNSIKSIIKKEFKKFNINII